MDSRMNHKNLQKNFIDGRYGIMAKLLENGSTVLNKIKQSSKNQKLAKIRDKRHFNKDELEEFRIQKRDFFFQTSYDNQFTEVLGPRKGKKSQKQPPRSGLSKKCSANMQQIYRRIPVPMCDFHKVAATLLKSHFGMGVLFSEFFHILKTTFLRTPLRGCF